MINLDSQIDKSSYTTMVLANKPISLGLGFKKIVFLSLLIILREIFLPTGSTTELAKFTDVTLEVGINFQHEKKLANFIQTINQKNLIVGGHDISDGGLLLALAEICILNGTGFILNSEDPRWLFGENQGLYLIICKKQNEMTIIEEAKVNNVPFEKLGYFNNGLFMIGKETAQIDELKIIFDNGLDELIN